MTDERHSEQAGGGAEGHEPAPRRRADAGSLERWAARPKGAGRPGAKAVLSPTEVKRLNREWRHKTEGRVALLLDSVQTPYNVGAIVRTAAAERVEHLYLAGASTPPSHPASRKVSLGTERYLEWSTHDDVNEALDAIKDAGLRLVGIELAEGAVPLPEATLGVDVCLALGHEDRGLSAKTLAACDEVAFIPQLGKVGSLNVAHAAAMAIYEARRRHWTR